MSRSAKNRKMHHRWKRLLKSEGASKLRSRTRQFLKKKDPDADSLPTKRETGDPWSYD